MPLTVRCRTHGDAGAGVPTTNNGLEANNRHFKSLVGGGDRKRLPVMEAVAAILSAVKTMSMRDTVPVPLSDALPTRGMTAHADNMYVALHTIRHGPSKCACEATG